MYIIFFFIFELVRVGMVLFSFIFLVIIFVFGMIKEFYKRSVRIEIWMMCGLNRKVDVKKGWIF